MGAHRRATFGLAIRAAALLCVCACLLSGCMPLLLLREINESLVSERATQRGELYGSVELLEGKTVFVSIFLNDKSTSWNTADRNDMLRRVSTGVSFIESEAQRYGKACDIVFDWDKDLRLACSVDYAGSIDPMGADWREVNAWLNRWIGDNVDAMELKRKYDAQSLGFFVYINMPGLSYADTFYVGDEDEWYYEKAVIYNFDIDEPNTHEGPGTCAHEALHLFGARDLYDAFEEDGITEDMVEYVERSCYDDIMYTTYDTLTGECLPYSVKGVIGPFTAYYTGLSDYCAEMESFPQADRESAGVFTYKYGH